MFTEHLETFFNDSEFAVAVNIAGVVVNAIFDNASANTLLGAMGARGVSLAGMAGSKPSLTLPSLNVPENAVGEAVTIAGADYLIAAHEPDGTGVSVLLLEVA